MERLIGQDWSIAVVHAENHEVTLCHGCQHVPSRRRGRVEECRGVYGRHHCNPRPIRRCGVELDLVALGQRASWNEYGDRFTFDERNEFGARQRKHQIPENQTAPATRMAMPATSEARIRYRVCTA